MSAAEPLLDALAFAATKHRDQRRKGVEASPYINHPIAVAHLLAHVGRVEDTEILQAALLHDTIEDTRTEGEELERHFGGRVRTIVEEVTDDTRLRGRDRKRLQVERAGELSRAARLVKLADKTCNVRDMTHAPPAGWGPGRRRAYVDWTEAVVDRIRGTNADLEDAYDRALAEARESLPGE